MTDVCLILEGTYPYTRGGVSACVYNLIANLPQINFSIVHLTATGDTPREIQYPLPSNIKEFKEFYLFDIDFVTEPAFDRTDKEDWNKIIHFHNYLKKRDMKNFEDVYRTF